MVSVVIPVFNKAEFTNRCLDSLLRNSRALSELTVVDNASSDSTPEVLRDWATRFETQGIRFRVIRNEQNAGFGRACNQGIRISTGAYVAIVNNDTWLMQGWDQSLIVEIEARSLDEVGPFFDERPWVENPDARAQGFLARNPNGFREHFVAMLMFFTRSAVERLSFDHGGLFD
jgi:glycosyltransferase involved in cell wall biosynthesis